MAELNLGEVVARLRLDSTDFLRGLTDARQALVQFGQAKDQIIQNLQRLQQANQQTQQTFQQYSQTLNQFNQTSQHFNQTLNQTNQTFNQTSQTINQSNQTVQNFNQTLTTINNTTRAAAQGAQGFGSAWGNVLSVAAGIGLATSIQGLLHGFIAFGTESVRLSARMQDLSLAFRAIEGSSTAANRTMGFLFETAQRVGVDFEKMADGFKRLDAAAKGTSLAGQGVRDVFAAVVAGGRALGISSEQNSQALVALEQILTKGKLSAEEYRRQLGNAVPGALGLMAQGLGVTTQALEELVALGVVPAESAIIAFAKSMGELGKGPGTEEIERISGTFAKLANETKAWMTALGDSISSTLQPFLQDLIKISEEVRKLFAIKPPGTQAVPGANKGGILNFLFPGPLTPTTLGLPPPGAYGPSETARDEPAVPVLGFAQSPYDALIQAEAARAGLDPALFSRLIQRESSFNPRATGPFIPGQGNARGLGQIMPATGADYGLTNAADFYDPAKNVPVAANVLRDYTAKLKKDFGDLDDLTRLALAAYNAGIGNVEKAIRETITIGEKVTYGQVLGRLPQPSQTGPYVQAIAGPYTQPGMTSAPTPWGMMPTQSPLIAEGTTSAAGKLDPFAPMVKQAGEVLAIVARIQKLMDALATSDLNQGGLLNDTMRKQAEEALKKFQEIATTLAAFPQALERMTPAQRDVLSLAAHELLVLQQKLQDEAQSAGNAQKRVQELRAIEALQAQLDAERERQEEQAAKAEMARIRQRVEAEERAAEQIQRARIQAFAKDLDIFGLDLPPEVERARRRSGATLQEMQNRLEQLQAPRGEGFFGETPLDVRLRQRQDATILPEQRGNAARLREQIAAQERLNYGIQLFGQLSESVGSAWVSALTSIADHTKTVGEAFREMARSILQSMAQIASQEAFRALFRVGAGLLTSALAPQGATYAGAGSGVVPYTPPPLLFGAQGGAIVNRPTTILAGENSSVNPEYVVNHPQMQHLLATAARSAGPSAGGQAAGITIINVGSRQEAETQKTQQEALGRRAVINYVMEDLNKGEASSLNRVIRTLNR